MLDHAQHHRATDRPVRNYYTNPQDAQKYLSQSLIRYKGEPCYVLIDYYTDSEGAGKIMAYLYKSSSFRSEHRIAIVHLDDPDLDISSPPIGYANIIQPKINKMFVVYVKRLPYQMWKQGLTLNNVSISLIDGDVYNSYSFPVLDTPGFYDSIKGIFPDFGTAVSLLAKGSLNEIAISRNIALQSRKSGLIIAYHKTKEFGYIPAEAVKADRPYVLTNNDLVGWAIKRNNPEIDIRINKVAA